MYSLGEMPERMTGIVLLYVNCRVYVACNVTLAVSCAHITLAQATSMQECSGAAVQDLLSTYSLVRDPAA